MLDQSFDALETFDWGSDPQVLQAIDEAIVASEDNASARRELEERLLAALQSDIPRAAQDFVCRKLRAIGTARSVATLAGLLGNEELSHLSRYALERLPAPEASAALRNALPQVSGKLKAGVIASLGVRRDNAAVNALAAMLSDPDALVAVAAAQALGAIRSAHAAKALESATPNAAAAPAATDALLACAEQLLKDGNARNALAIYRRLASGTPPKHVQLAATRGMLACAGADR
jgi:HEAT repeat protein